MSAGTHGYLFVVRLGDVLEVVRCELDERLHFEARHLLQDEPIVCK